MSIESDVTPSDVAVEDVRDIQTFAALRDVFVRPSTRSAEEKREAT